MADIRATPRRAEKSDDWLMLAVLLFLLVGIIMLAAFVVVTAYATAQTIDNPLIPLWQGTRPM